MISWGGTGHRIISEKSSLSFNSEMSQFTSWVAILIDHASDADNRKGSDPNESPKHYIDIDKYSEFLSDGRIPQTLDSAVQAHGSYNVYDWGILPWATLAAFDSVKSCLQRHNFSKASLFAADLGHYVADGHMPLHITANYNGQLTGNDGIHSRYESTMINGFASQINYSGRSIAEISDMRQYVFNYLYHNYKYVDSIMLADNYAKNFSSNTSSDAYKNALWNKTKGFTIALFRDGSHALAELIYNAWIQSGRPSITGIDQLFGERSPIMLNDCHPNPFTRITHISFNLQRVAKVHLSIYSTSGKLVDDLVNGTLSQGDYGLDWITDNLPSGIYYLVLQGGNTIETRKLLLVN